jgi:hypothetical protein
MEWVFVRPSRWRGGCMDPSWSLPMLLVMPVLVLVLMGWDGDW